jgi:hypothetical protein
MTESKDDTPGPDPDLVGLVQLADGYGLEYDIVLTLAGQVVEGTLISARQFASNVADVAQGQDPDGTLRGALAARFRKHADELEDFGATSKLGDLDPEGPESQDLRSMPDVRHIHLRDATASSLAGRTLPLWRGRLVDIVGWTLVGVGG